MIGISDVANEILRRCIDELRANELQRDGLIMAQAICHQERNNDSCKVLIAEYTELADKKTDGAFSASLESWDSVKH